MRTSPPPDRVTDAQLYVNHGTIVTEDAPVPKFHQISRFPVMPSRGGVHSDDHAWVRSCFLAFVAVGIWAIDFIRPR